MKRLFLDSQAVDAGDRFEFVRAALGTMIPIDLSWPDHRDGISAHGSMVELGDLMFSTGRTSARKVERTTKLARDSMEPSVIISLPTSGSQVVVQGGREAVARPGQMVVLDSDAPYTLLDDTGVVGHFYRIPHSALALPHSVIRQVSAVELAPDHPITTLTADYLHRLALNPELTSAPNADLLGHPSIELVRALLLTHVRADDLATEPMAATLQLRILEYVRENLHEPDLSPEQIAAANYISVRYLYKVLSRNGIGLADWIRTHRLEACRQALTTAPRSVTVAAIARRNGFSDMSSFSRSFRAEYGMTPREWRERHRH